MTVRLAWFRMLMSAASRAAGSVPAALSVAAASKEPCVPDMFFGGFKKKTLRYHEGALLIWVPFLFWMT